MNKGEKISVRFVEMKCYKCGTLNHLFFVDSVDSDEVRYGFDSSWSNDKKSLSHEIVECVEAYAKTDVGKMLNLAKVGMRYSKTVGKSYVSFGCSKCDAIFGDWYVKDLYAETQNDKNPNIVELTI